MKDYRTIPGPWSGRKKIKYVSAIPPRDWKYWTMVVLTFLWFVLLTFILWKANNVPTAAQWWKDRTDQERPRGRADRLPAARPAADGAKIPFPKEGDYYKLSFDTLAGFPAGEPDITNSRLDPHLKAQKAKIDVPPSVQAVDGQRISVAGFMIPMTIEKDQVLSFILAQSRMTCCYGVTPKLNQWIYVTMGGGKSVEQWMDVPVTVFGTLSVGAKFDTENKGWCLYRMDGDKVVLPKKSWF
jgi:hypothetical protein